MAFGSCEIHMKEFGTYCLKVYIEIRNSLKLKSEVKRKSIWESEDAQLREAHNTNFSVTEVK